MSIRNLTILAAILAAVPLPMPAQNASLAKRSVVRITAHIGSGSIGTGFMWADSSHVVTALHVVAGAPYPIAVYSEALKQPVGARIQAVNLEADLALLKLDSPLSLPPLQSRATAPDLDALHKIWGYPLNAPEMSSRSIRFSEGMNDTSTMASMFQDRYEFANAVGSQGYPRWQTRVLKVESTILNGHSGAPILDQNGTIVGIGDGGLDEGIKGRNWAIPAQVYLQNINQFRDQPPAVGQISVKAKTLFSVSAPASTSIGLVQANAGAPARAALTWAGSGRLYDLVRKLPNDEQDDYWDLAKMVDNRDHFLAGIMDIYEDSLTRATIAVPRGLTLAFDPATHYLQAKTPSRNLSLTIQIQENKSRSQAVVAWNAFDQWIRTGANWQRDTRYKPEVDGSSTGDYDVTRHLVAFKNGQAVAWLEEELDIDGTDFLGTAVFAASDHGFTPAEKEIYKWMEACSMLSDFGN